MTWQLATRVDAHGASYPMDFGILSEEDGGYLVVTRGAYVCRYAPDIKLSDVTITDVPDDYQLPTPPPQE